MSEDPTPYNAEPEPEEYTGPGLPPEPTIDNVVPINGIAAQPSDDPAELPEPPPIVLLDDIYVKAFMGPTVSVSEHTRAAYSLHLLVIVEMATEQMSEDAAQVSIANKVAAWSAQYGAAAPVFIDDAISRPKEKSKIIRPGGFGRSRLR
ncbi:MAG: hypothetical protein WC718_00115 [Phycisphaerales bacterium]|jgi:hypothetical protein